MSNEIYTLATDFDGVVGSIAEGSLAACKAATGRDHPATRWTNYDMYQEFDMTLDQYLNALIDHKVLETAIMQPGVRAAFQLAQASGFQVAVITARDFHPNKLVTHEWARLHNVHFDHVKLVGNNESKVDAIMSLENVVGYADDLPRHLEQLRAAGFAAPLYLMNQPWNAGYVGFERVESVPDYVHKVLKGREQLVRPAACAMP